MFSPFSLITSIKVQEVHPQKRPPAKPELTSDIWRIKKAMKTQKNKRFSNSLYITHTENKQTTKRAVTILLLKNNILVCNCKCDVRSTL